jgi:hypothetical protein
MCAEYHLELCSCPYVLLLRRRAGCCKRDKDVSSFPIESPDVLSSTTKLRSRVANTRAETLHY